MILDNPALYVVGYVAAWGILVLAMLAAARIFRGRADQGRRWRLLSNITAVFLSIMIFILAMEGYFGFFYDRTDSFGNLLTSRRWLKRHYRYNNWGFRDDKDYSYKKFAGKKRVVFIGDSYTIGHGIERLSDRFSNRIEWRLSKKTSSEVYTIAVGGWDTIDEVGFLDKLANNGFEADLIVLCYSMNDLSSLSVESNINLQKIRDQAPHNWLLRNSFFLNFVYVRVKILSMPEVKSYFDWLGKAYEDEEVWSNEKKLLEDLIDLSRGKGYKIKVVIFPLIGDLSRGFKMENAHKKVADFFRSRGVDCVDMAEGLKEFPEKKVVVNKFDAHPNEFAHSVIADEIWEKLIKGDIKASVE